ncbi:MAG: hypothetical protein ACRDQ5_11845 [Sciscionella sp.]
MSAEELEQRPVRLPSGPAWFAADTSNGACHYGQLHTQSAVHAVCGAVFTPLRNPMSGVIAWWRRPVDAEHGCGACWEAR